MSVLVIILCKIRYLKVVGKQAREVHTTRINAGKYIHVTVEMHIWFF